MPLPVIANTFRVTLNYAYVGGRTAHNVLHVRAASATDADVVGSAVDGALNADMVAYMTSDASIIGLDCLELDGTSSTETVLRGTPLAGGGGLQGLIQVACLIQFRTGLRGPSKRGRLFLPYVAEGSTNGGEMTTSALTDLSDGWDAFVTSLAAATPALTLVVASYTLGSAVDVTDINFEVVTATQRKRLRR